jgi:queuine/archaeosine tRNA-ribosyltransferase
VHYLLDLMRRIREAIVADTYPQFLRDYFSTLHAGDKTKYPSWIVDALRSVDVDLMVE